MQTRLRRLVRKENDKKKHRVLLMETYICVAIAILNSDNQVMRVLKMRSDLIKNRILYRRLETNRYLCTIIQNKMGINKLKVVLTEEAQAFLDA